MTCDCKNTDPLEAAVAEITAAAGERIDRVVNGALTAAGAQGDERLALLEARINDLEAALANIIASEVEVASL